MIYLQADVQSLGISQPRFDLFQRVRVYAKYEDGEVFEGKGVISGLLIEDAARYPTSQFFIDGWWYDVMFYELPTCPHLALPLREWVHEGEIYPLR